mmetsp:Transcript_25928/g.74372  ORF Transcript_25928/g.74372 Transcript_25928/m.74372 type:complete len:217 (-) Transcript_25928:604-1254(-)
MGPYITTPICMCPGTTALPITAIVGAINPSNPISAMPATGMCMVESPVIQPLAACTSCGRRLSVASAAFAADLLALRVVRLGPQLTVTIYKFKTAYTEIGFPPARESKPGWHRVLPETMCTARFKASAVCRAIGEEQRARPLGTATRVCRPTIQGLANSHHSHGARARSRLPHRATRRGLAILCPLANNPAAAFSLSWPAPKHLSQPCSVCNPNTP